MRVLFWICLFCLAVGIRSDEEEGDEEEIRFTPQLSHVSDNLWSNILWNATSGKVSRDFLTEKLVFQMFNETVKPKLMAGKSPLDPLLLWPIGPEVIKKTLFKGKFRACSLYLHNMKSIELKDFEVQRDEKMTFQALRVKILIPHLNVTGFYKLSDSKVMKLFKTDSKGNFTIAIDEIVVESIITLKTNLENDSLPVMANNTLKLDEINLDIKWKKIKFKFDGLRKGLRHITHWLMNKVVASKLAKTQGDKIDSLVEEYIRSLLECLMFHASKGFEACDLQFWFGKGFSYPTNFFDCDD